MSFYGEMQGIAAEILTEFQMDGITYIQITPGDGPIDNPGPPTETPIPILNGVARGVDEKYVDGTQVKETDGQVTFAVGSFVPNVRDFIEVGGKRCKIVATPTIPPTGTPVTYVVVYNR